MPQRRDPQGSPGLLSPHSLIRAIVWGLPAESWAPAVSQILWQGHRLLCPLLCKGSAPLPGLLPRAPATQSSTRGSHCGCTTCTEWIPQQVLWSKVFQYRKKTTWGWNSFQDYSGSMRKLKLFHICQLFSSQKTSSKSHCLMQIYKKKLNKIWHQAFRYRSSASGGGSTEGRANTQSINLFVTLPTESLLGACKFGRIPYRIFLPKYQCTAEDHTSSWPTCTFLLFERS